MATSDRIPARPGMTLWRNAAQLGTAKVLSSVLGLLWTVVLARSLGLSEFGEYTYLVALTVLLSLFAEGGFANIVIRDVASDPGALDRTVPTAMALTLALNLAACLAAIGIAVLDQPTTGRFWSATLAAAYIPANGLFNMISAVFRGHNRFDYDSTFNLIYFLLFAVLSGVALLLGWGAVGVIGAHVVRMYLVLAASAAVCMMRVGRLRIAFVPERARYLFKEGLPLVLSGAAAQVYVRIDIVVLSFVAGTNAVALYSVAARFTDALTTAANVLGFASLPVLAEMWRDDPRRAHQFTQATVGRALLLTLLAAAGGAIIARPLIRHLYGLPFGVSGQILQILLAAVPLSAASQILSALVIASSRQRALVWIFGGAAVLSTFLNFLLAARWQYFGSAASNVATATFVAVTLWWLVQRLEKERIARA